MKRTAERFVIQGIIGSVVLGTTLLCGCEKEYIPIEESRGVIDGRFRSDGYPDIVFSRSIVPQEEGKLSEVVISANRSRTR